MSGKLVSEGLLITDVDGEWEVWCGADGEDIINAHLIGRGATKAAAVGDAIVETETLLARLRAQHGSLQPKIVEREPIACPSCMSKVATFTVKGEPWGTMAPTHLRWYCKCGNGSFTLAELIEHGIADHGWPEGLRQVGDLNTRLFTPGDYGVTP